MTDILIRGMEMPKGCKSCKLSSDSHCNATGQWLFSTDLLRSGFNWKTCRLPDCPLVEVPKWISVEERLPKSGERVLIMFKPFEDDENISIGWLTKSGFDCYDDSVYFFRSVTHWMPLPEAPKEDAE